MSINVSLPQANLHAHKKDILMRWGSRISRHPLSVRSPVAPDSVASGAGSRPPGDTPMPRHDQASLIQTARAAWEAGISVIPIAANGTKCPAVSSWKRYQQERPTERDIRRWFFPGCRCGLGYITGSVSGGLEALDFDGPDSYQNWRAAVECDPALSTLYRRIAGGYEEVSPGGGRHLLYRCPAIQGNRKLARRPVPTPERFKTLIETRGEGGLIIVAPSGGRVHPSGNPYRLLSGGLALIVTIAPSERTLLLESCRAFDAVAPPTALSAQERSALRCGPDIIHDPLCLRPGDIFNQRASWEDILIPHGWEPVRVVGEETYWRRPGKRGPGHSATTNYRGLGYLYVFSVATVFEPEKAYSKFAAYTILKHGGDFSAAARTLAAQGYGGIPRLPYHVINTAKKEQAMPRYAVYHTLDQMQMVLHDERQWFDRRATAYLRVAEVETPRQQKPLDQVFERTNHVDTAWTDNPEVVWYATDRPLRSTSVGDVIVDASGRAWMVMPSGFKLLRQPKEEAK
jgi:hypothetical protein